MEIVNTSDVRALLPLMARGVRPTITVLASNPRMGVLIERYREVHCRGLRRRRNAERFLDLHFGPLMELNRYTIGAGEIVEWHRAIAEKWPSAAYIALKHLRTMFNRGIYEWGLHPGPNPTAGIKLRRPPRRLVYVRRTLEMPRLVRVLDEQPPMVGAYFYTLLYTGARRTEVLLLEWEHWDIDQRRLAIFQPKSNSFRHAYVCDHLSEVLSRLPRTCKYIFASRERPGERYSESWAQQNWSAIRKDAHLPNVCIHALRHTLGSWLGQAGESSFVIRDALGHKSVTTTEIYTHLDDSVLMRAFGKHAEQIAQVRAATGTGGARH